MLKEHAKIMVLLQEAGEITGRKKLQKIVYISKKYRFHFQEKFNFHFYGPYSDELSLRIEELADLHFIEETKEQKGGYFQYKYRLSEQGKAYLDVYPTSMQGYGPFVKVLNEQSSRFLELVSTMLFFEHLTREELIQKVHKVKNKLKYTQEEIEEGFRFLEQLRQFYQ